MVPWPIKIAAKVVLARLPIPREAWNRLGVFRHGPNADPAYAYDVFTTHLTEVNPSPGFTTLELGPGDALASAVLAPAFGGKASVQVDVAPFARRHVEIYREIADFARQRGHAPPLLDDVTSFDDVLARCGARYLTDGLTSLRSIPSGSIDFIFSHAALEHVRAAEFIETMHELRRVVAPGGGASHQIDLADHLSDGLNNLRFGDRLWESALMANSGFYTNRFGYSDILQMLSDAKFSTNVVAVQRWARPPLGRSALSPRFRTRTDDELSVRGFHILCTPT